MPSVHTSLGDRIAAARHARFVGREVELGQFAAALEAPSLPFHLAHVYGPGGIGKTTLLDEVARLALEAGAHVGRLDGRDLEARPAAFEAAAEAALGSPTGRRVLLVDTYERIDALDGWLRRSFLPALEDGDLIVIAGRNRPSAEWRSWAGEAVVVPLRNLTALEAATYLDAQGIPDHAHDHVLGFTHGHPLALTLVAEHVRQSGGVAFDPTSAPDLLADLLSRFASAAPSAGHRVALEAASVVPSLTVPLLDELWSSSEPDGPSTDDVFAWLRGLGFVESGANGVRLHDVVRETVEADFRWRDPERYAQVHARARRAYARRLRQATMEAARRRALSDYVDLYRHHALVRPLLTRLQSAWADADLEGSGPLRDGDIDVLEAGIAQHQSALEAERVAGWMRRHPQGVEVFRTTAGDPAGFLLTLDLGALEGESLSADPVAAAAWDGGVSVRPGERTLLFRSWLDLEAGQGVSAVQSLVFERTVERYLSTPSLATSVLMTTEPDLWSMVLAFVGITRWESAEMEDGPAAFGKDWRATPPDAWLEALAAQAPSDPVLPVVPATVVVLSQDAFAAAALAALKTYARPHRLVDNPLTRSRMVREALAESSSDDAVGVLRNLVLEAARQLEAGPRERGYFRVLEATYLEPAPTQAVASENLDIPFSTYRRHLKRGVDHVVGALWRLETGA
ncbi:ATP-binding protein [Rubrivirga sp.]|uniref:ATP-binding protein n=1 Tax=Rubrivirga sp. TaxID=1885344 RepID=UPI003C71C519